jgi:hypothetical protein
MRQGYSRGLRDDELVVLTMAVQRRNHRCWMLKSVTING